MAVRPLRADERLGATERSQGSRAAIAGREHAVRVRELTKRYGEAPAVEGASFTLDPETITRFLGPNGAGKATTLRILLGLARPRAGEALLFGVRYEALERPVGLVARLDPGADERP